MNFIGATFRVYKLNVLFSVVTEDKFLALDAILVSW